MTDALQEALPAMTGLVIISLSAYNPSVDVAGVAAEVHADAEDLAWVLCERQGVLLFHDLLHGFLCGAVQLELHDIDIIRGLEHKVNPSARGVVFHFCV